jgi:predicted CxxxxCH...CXXCH cytochrome family protein
MFAPEDYSNPFGTTSLSRGSKLQTSHKWFGADVVPGAGTLAPVDTSLNGLNKSANFQGTLFCARCHNVHGTSGDQSVDAPYLRYPNDTDQLCLNCHRPRDTNNHTVGTHPVNVNYTSAANKQKVIDGTLYANPIVNATNPTGQVKLVNGKIVCSTCHRTHNTDSRASTFDPYSTSHTFGKLSSSKGYLLRVDPYGKTVNNLNICINCHNGKKNHNQSARNGHAPAQCNDCHSGHVEYDPAATGGETTPNVWLVRRYLQYSTAGRVSKRVIFNSTTVKNYYNVNGTGVCQSCHNPPANHFSGANLDSSRTNCNNCHLHNEAAGSFSYGTGTGCSNSCHGIPPKVASGIDGPATGYTRFNESTTPHASHAAGGGSNVNDFDCTECHKGFVMENGNFVEIFKDTANVIASKNSATPSYNSTTATCNNVYCHSNGNGIWKSGMGNVQWGNIATGIGNKGLIVGKTTECITCHDDPNSSSSHTKHVSLTAGTGMGYGCVTCHAATVSNNTTLLASAKVVNGTHTNGVKDVYFVGTGAAVGTSCSNIACHSNGKGAPSNIAPVWGSAPTGACGACHWTQTSSTVLSTGSHTKHFSIIGGTNPATVCASCHIYTTETAVTHVNGTLDVTTGCTTCHSDPYSASASTPTWGTSSPGCGACHSGTGAFVGVGSGPATGAHNKHMGLAAVNCASCHTGAVAGTTGGNFHMDGNIDVAVANYPANITKHALGSYVGTCSTTCHSVTNVAAATPTWGATANCNSCHTASPTTGTHTKHIAASGITCGSCHTGASAGLSGGNGHYDGFINVAVSGYPANVTKHAAGTFGSSTCSTMCHSTSNVANTTPTWGAIGGCATCHAVSPTTGAHTRHTAFGTVTCASCHTGAVSGSTGGPGHYDGVINVSNGYPANVAKHAVGSYAGTCSTSTCHGSFGTPTWGYSSTNDFCTKCHGTKTASVTAGNRYLLAPSDAAGVGAGKVSANTKTGAHETHLNLFNGFNNYSTVDYRCEACHGTLPAANTFTHADGTSSPIGQFKNLATNWGKMTGQAYTTGGTCSNTYCHNPAGTNGTLSAGAAGANTAPSWTDSTYIADGTHKTLTNCNKCHRVPGEAQFTGYAHGSVTIADSCVGCHGHDGDTQGTVGKRHMDGIKWGAGNCDSCHGYPPLSAADFAAKGAGFVNAKTEDYAGGGGHHATHLATTVVIGNGFTPCLPCHPNSGLGYHNQGGGVVNKANVNVNDATDMGYRFDSNRAKRYNSSAKTCSNVSCHFQPTSAW